MARAAACFNPNSDVESSIEDFDQSSVRLQNVVANKKDEPLNDNKNNPCYVLIENEVIQNTTSPESWQEITDSGNYGLEYSLTHNTPDLHQSKDQVLTENVTQSVPIASQYVNQKQFAEHVLKEGTKTFTDLGFDESMSEPPTPLPTRRPRMDSELSCSVSTMSEISTSSSQLQTQNRPGRHVHIYNMHIAKADLRTVHTEKAEITNVNIDKAENVSSSNDSNKTNSRNTDAGLKIIDDAEWHISFHEENGIRLNNTQVFHEAVKKLGWNKVIVIVGNSGCGKRSLSMELLRHFSNEETEFGCTPVIIKDSCDWNTHVNPRCEYIILLDSLCGSAGIFNREHFLKWDPYFKDILKYIKNSKEFNEPFFVIMTMRDKIWKENKIFFREYDLFRELENYIFDMTNEYGFSCKELSDKHVGTAERSMNSVFIETVRECKRKQDEQRQQDKKSSCNIL